MLTILTGVVALAGAPGISVRAAILALGGFRGGALLTGVAITHFRDRHGALFTTAPQRAMP